MNLKQSEGVIKFIKLIQEHKQFMSLDSAVLWEQFLCRPH